MTAPKDRRTSWSDAAPHPYWLDTPDRPAGAAGARRRPPHRPRRRRRRVHRALDRPDGQGARPSARRRADRGRPDRRRGHRAQRRLLLREPHPRRGQRARAVARRVRRAAPPRHGEPRRDRRDDRALRHRLRLPAHRRARGGDATARARGVRLVGTRLPRRRGAAGAGRLADVPRRHVGPRRHRDARPRAAGLGTRRGGRGGRRADRRAYAGHRAQGVRRPDRPGHRERQRHRPGGSRSRPTRSRRCSSG